MVPPLPPMVASRSNTSLGLPSAVPPNKTGPTGAPALMRWGPRQSHCERGPCPDAAGGPASMMDSALAGAVGAAQTAPARTVRYPVAPSSDFCGVAVGPGHGAAAAG